MIAILIIVLVIWSLEQGKKTKKTTKRVAKLEKEQERQRREQERQRKEQERQAKQLAKHEEEIFKLNQKVNRLSAKVEHLDARIAGLEELRNRIYTECEQDYYDKLLIINGWKSHEFKLDEKTTRKLLALDNQIASARDQRQRALDDIEAAQRKLSA